MRGQKIDTIYFGGGTPSILDAKDIELILNEIFKHHNATKNMEITLEMNPEDASPSKLSSLKSIGINRLSLGIQTFDDKTLKLLNRIHDSKASFSAIKESRKVGFDNLNLDLILSIPGREIKTLDEDIQMLVNFEPEHISTYSLTIEDKTAFGVWTKKGQFSPVSDENDAIQYEFAIDSLVEKGYEHYEVSNFCRSGNYSQHNLKYWNGSYYLGIGPGSHSYNGNTRQINISNNNLYYKCLENNSENYYELEQLSKSDKINDYILTRIRTKWGINLEYLYSTFSIDLTQSKRNFISLMEKENFLVKDFPFIRLTKKGMLVADKICQELMIT